MKLLKVDLLEQALDKLEETIKSSGEQMAETEEIPVYEALGRILAEDIVSGCNIPDFDRSTVDGYAVVSSDVAGAGESVPAFLEVAGEVEMGKAAPGTVSSGRCMYVPTGGMVPEGADSVVMVEYTQPFTADQIAVYTSSSAGRNMVFKGDDVKEGELLLARGRRIRPADMGLLSGSGFPSVKVYKPWKVYIISTGDEVVGPQETPGPGQVRDVNTYGLLGEAQQAGFLVAGWKVLKDDKAVLKKEVGQAMKDCDLVVISGGSSKGKKDATEAVIDEITSSGVITHGLAVKPGKPTILGFDGPSGCIVAGLPGHPAAALLLFRMVCCGIWASLTGTTADKKEITVPAVMAANLAASPGRKTFQLVSLDYENADEETGLPLAVPLLGKSGLIKNMSRADGYVVIGVNDEGIGRGRRADVILL